ncbi:hypothetical protein EIP86_004504 [Pleurotus ostreatoroseus]|nr:hypothetical protein EIP86_004504 [Pleurotus ostreatoroseus]
MDASDPRPEFAVKILLEWERMDNRLEHRLERMVLELARIVLRAVRKPQYVAPPPYDEEPAADERGDAMATE